MEREQIARAQVSGPARSSLSIRDCETRAALHCYLSPSGWRAATRNHFPCDLLGRPRGIPSFLVWFLAALDCPQRCTSVPGGGPLFATPFWLWIYMCKI